MGWPREQSVVSVVWQEVVFQRHGTKMSNQKNRPLPQKQREVIPLTDPFTHPPRLPGRRQQLSSNEIEMSHGSREAGDEAILPEGRVCQGPHPCGPCMCTSEVKSLQQNSGSPCTGGHLLVQPLCQYHQAAAGEHWPDANPRQPEQDCPGPLEGPRARQFPGLRPTDGKWTD